MIENGLTFLARTRVGRKARGSERSRRLFKPSNVDRSRLPSELPFASATWQPTPVFVRTHEFVRDRRNRLVEVGALRRLLGRARPGREREERRDGGPAQQGERRQNKQADLQGDAPRSPQRDRDLIVPPSDAR